MYSRDELYKELYNDIAIISNATVTDVSLQLSIKSVGSHHKTNFQPRAAKYIAEYSLFGVCPYQICLGNVTILLP